jgi:hypothetical protein
MIGSDTVTKPFRLQLPYWYGSLDVYVGAIVDLTHVRDYTSLSVTEGSPDTIRILSIDRVELDGTTDTVIIGTCEDVVDEASV